MHTETKAALQNQADAYHVWAKAITFLNDKNGKKSLHAPSTNLEFGEHVPAVQRARWITNLEQDITSPVGVVHHDKED
jgi:hypothetical protein